MPRKFKPTLENRKKGGRRFYASRSQRVEAKRARRAARAASATLAQEIVKAAFQARQLERGLTNMGGNYDKKSE